MSGRSKRVMRGKSIRSSGIARVATRMVRSATNFLRPLPDLLLIGSEKTGSTSLHHQLVQHPRIIGAAGKELFFFDRNFNRGVTHYRSHFPMIRGRVSGRRILDGTPTYLFYPQAPRRIKNLIPHARMIVILRDPVERAISNYFHWTRLNMEPLPMRQAFEAEEERCRASFERMFADPTFDDRAAIRYSYLRKGIYADALARFWAFFPRDQFHIIRSEDFFGDPYGEIARVFRFAGVEDTFLPRDLRPLNVGENRAQVPEDVRAMLRGFFAPHNRRLEEMLGRSMGWD